MRPPVDAGRIRELARALGRVARGRVRVYLTGGATAVLEGWRASTLDVDLRFEPEADELLRALSELKERLGINVELASPPDFIPELPGWRERSPFVFREGNVDVHHFDPYSQALSKLERAFAHDLQDVDAMLARGLVRRERLRELYLAIEPDLYRYPAIDPSAFARRVGERTQAHH
jgi:nucleotide-binding universal stress UspA family protein